MICRTCSNTTFVASDWSNFVVNNNCVNLIVLIMCVNIFLFQDISLQYSRGHTFCYINCKCLFSFSNSTIVQLFPNKNILGNADCWNTTPFLWICIANPIIVWRLMYLVCLPHSLCFQTIVFKLEKDMCVLWGQVY